MAKEGVYAYSTFTDSLKLERTMITQACFLLLLQLELLASSSTEAMCSVTRMETGDRIVFADFKDTCNQGVNPCHRIAGSDWRSSKNGCTCKCSVITSTYREDNRSCVLNKQNRRGCTLLFSRETDTDTLRVFDSYSSIKLRTLPRESCEAKETFFMTEGITSGWKQLQAVTPPFYIRHEDRKKKRHAHFLEWTNGQPVAKLFGKIVKVNIECQRGGQYEPRKLCIVFKVKGSISLSCLVGLPSPSPPTAATTAATMIIPNKTGQTNVTTKRPLTDVVIVTVDPNTTPTNPSITDKDNRESHYVGKKVALPIWLIAVIAGGAVIATLTITAIIWMCCKMKRRHRKRQKKRTRLVSSPGNTLYNNDDDTVITFAPSGGEAGVGDAGYARVGSPCHKGYAFLKAGPERTRSEYQRLVKPGEDHSGYLVPMEERNSTATTAAAGPCTTDTAAIYSEAVCPPPQDKPKDKDYDYAKPEDVACLTASRSSLNNLDICTVATTDPGYVEAKERSEDNGNGPSSPLYATVEGPSSPELSPEGGPSDVPSERAPLEVSSAGTPLENGLDEAKPEYVEVLPDTDSESRNSLIKENSEA